MKSYYKFVILFIYLVGLILFGCSSSFTYSIGCADVSAGQDYTFFILSDPHYLSKSMFDNKKAFRNFLASGDGKLIQYSNELLDAFQEEIVNEKPDFLILTGDLTCNGCKTSHINFSKELKNIEDNGTCVFVVPGNHDIQNPWAKKYTGDKASTADFISEDEFLSLYAAFGYEQAVSRDPNSLSYLANPTEDTWLLMLDSTIFEGNYQKHYPERAGSLSAETIDWVNQCANLAKENGARIIAVMHHSLINHSKEVYSGYTLNDNEEILKAFHKNQIEIVFTGHVHIQDIKTHKYEENTLYDIATSSISVYPHQYGRVDFSADEGFFYRTVKLDMENWANSNKISDEALLNFDVYSEKFFREQCCSAHKNYLLELTELSKENRTRIANVVSQMNMLYFSGYRNEALDYIVNTEDFKILNDIPPCFVKSYVMNMINDERTDNNKLFIPK